MWQCNEKNRGQHCKTPHLTEANIQAAFLIAFNRILGKREEIIEAYHEVMEALTDTTDLDTEREQLQSECEVVMGLISGPSLLHIHFEAAPARYRGRWYRSAPP